MAYSVFMTDWGEVRLSPSEARMLEAWGRVRVEGIGDAMPAYYRNKMAAKIADIERVAKWKCGRKSVS